MMDNFIRGVLNAHEPKEETHLTYPDAKKILANIDQELIWKYERPEFYKLVTENSYENKKCSNASSVVQLLMFFHYFFHRTCLSIIVPSSEDWAFDIFQSLNATGTPLTAIETFKPLVVNTVNKYNNSKFKGSKSESYFIKIDDLFENYDTAEKKTKLTKEFLNVFRLIYEGKSLSNHFSQQRKWLNDSYNNLKTKAEKEEFVHRLANLAEYWVNVKNLDYSDFTIPAGLGELEDNELAILCIKYLDDASHRMADTILSRFYARVLRGIDGAGSDFIEASKAIAAFFTIWRSAFSNTGLDEVYRKLFELTDDLKQPNYSWINSEKEYSVQDLKTYLLSVLENKSIEKEDFWLEKASKNLKYDTAKTVCRFTLLVSSHNTIPDPDINGLTKKGKKGVNPYLGVEHYLSSDLRTIEHIAPQSNEDMCWENEIYSSQVEHLIGNLTLLPLDINSSLGNKSWKEKVIYYRHLALIDDDEATNLNNKAALEGIVLLKQTIDRLTRSTHASHINPIVVFAQNGGEWDHKFIKTRSLRICELLWGHIRPWLD